MVSEDLEARVWYFSKLLQTLGCFGASVLTVDLYTPSSRQSTSKYDHFLTDPTAFTECDGPVVHYPSIHVLLPALMQSELLSVQRRGATLDQVTQTDKHPPTNDKFREHPIY